MTLKLAILPGDGTGPEVVVEAVKVLAAVSRLEGFDYTTEEFDFGGDRYLASGHIIDEDDIERLRAFDPTSSRAFSRKGSCFASASRSTSTSTCGP